MRALPQHERDRAEDHHRADRRQHRAHPRATDRDGEGILDRLAVALAVQRLERERLHGLDRVERFAGEAAGVGDAILRLPRQRAQPAADDDQRHDHQRNQQQDHAGERRAGRDQQHQCADQLNRRAQRDRQIHAGDRLHQRRVGRQSRQHFAGARHFEERRVHADDARCRCPRAGRRPRVRRAR